MAPRQAVWFRQVTPERDNIRSALANAIDAGSAELAVQLVANHPYRQSASTSPIGEVFSVARVLELPGAAAEPGYPRVLMVAAYHTIWTGDYHSADELCQQALEAERRLLAPLQGPRIESDVCALQAQAALGAGAYPDAVSGYARAAELAAADGFPGIAAMYLAFGVSSAVLGGGAIDQAAAKAEESVALARRSGNPAAIVMSLNALALTLVEHDPERARALLQDSVKRGTTPGEEISQGFVTACLVAGCLRDWDLTLALTARSMYLWRWSMPVLQAATCLAECARVFAQDRPEVAGVLQGAAYAAFRRASPAPIGTRRSDTAPVDPNANFVLTALRETGDMVGTALGDQRRRELRNEGAAMSIDEAISYALANIDPKLITDPLAIG
jgi:ATP/maltotriose-dependent transcriptional regulator MalT